MARIIEFSHPGLQLNLTERSINNGIAYRFANSNTGVRYWNNEKDHYRKFIQNKGHYLKNLNSTPQKDDLLFWGEWEPQSDFSLTGLSVKLKPNAIHKPFISICGVGAHNTDPFVFGANFYYSNCKQNKNNMNNLNTGDLIIFGTEYDNGFALDTVFVIENSVTAQTYLNSPAAYPSILRQATLDLNNMYQNNLNFRLYKGLIYNSNLNKKEIFSFFPCKLKSQGEFERPLLDFNKFNLQSPGARTVLKDINYSSVSDFWLDLVNQITIQGYFLGIQTDMPPTRNNINFPTIKKVKGC